MHSKDLRKILENYTVTQLKHFIKQYNKIYKSHMITGHSKLSRNDILNKLADHLSTHIKQRSHFAVGNETINQNYDQYIGKPKKKKKNVNLIDL